MYEFIQINTSEEIGQNVRRYEMSFKYKFSAYSGPFINI